MAPPLQKGPKGTRDLYPEDVLRLNYIRKAWRDTAVRHGFDEVEGPTFEHSELYAVKSGDAILGELFQAFSGKDPKEVEAVKDTGRGPYAMRPEFTPSLARMYAAKAGQLPKPCRWFTAGPYFRAERPQRGRLREFQQWNVDVLGLAESEASVDASRHTAEADVIAVVIGLFETLGLKPDQLRIKLGSRDAVSMSMQQFGLDPSLEGRVLQLLDDRPKIGPDKYIEQAASLGLPDGFVKFHHPKQRIVMRLDDTPETLTERYPEFANNPEGVTAHIDRQESAKHSPGTLQHALFAAGLQGWCEFDSMIVRGLAYYTGTVFEAIADGERAVCGGGRYDNLVQLFGGPETPAVGFGMGDVVLSLLLDDRGVLPEGSDLREALSLAPAGLRPDAFVLAANDEAAERVPAVLTDLRRTTSMIDPTGIGLHARRSTKSTRNVGKLLKDAANQHARFAVILESPTEASIKDLGTGDQAGGIGIETLRTELAGRLGRACQ
ncbi:MAG: ATP phosphoribosyltransferase regulatory subunit [Planctomycetota bacterium]